MSMLYCCALQQVSPDRDRLVTARLPTKYSYQKAVPPKADLLQQLVSESSG